MSLFTDSPIECLQKQIDSMKSSIARIRIEPLFAPTVQQAENARKISIDLLTSNITLYEKALAILKIKDADLEILPQNKIENGNTTK